MHLIARALRVASLFGLVTLASAAPASAQTALTAEATVWLTPGAPADSAARVVVHIADPSAPAPGVAERITLYLPPEVTLRGAEFPTCALATVYASGPEGCSPGSQVGSGRVVSRIGPLGAALMMDAYVINGAEAGQLILAVVQQNGPVRSAIAGRLGPSDDPAFGSAVTFAVPQELRHAGGLDNAISDVDLLLRASAPAPFVAVAGCPLGSLPFKALVAWDPSAETVPPGPLTAFANAACVAGPPPAPAAMPQSASSPRDVRPGAQRAAGKFGVELERRRSKIVRLRLTGVARDAAVSARCLRRCGRTGGELIASRRGATARLRRPLRARSRFELRVSGPDLVTRFTRYEVNRKRTRLRKLAGGCPDDGGQARACPPPS